MKQQGNIVQIEQKPVLRGNKVKLHSTKGQQQRKCGLATCKGRACADCNTFMVYLCKRIIIGDTVFSVKEWRNGVYLKSLLR